ncbi:PEP-CTERM protein-sorting domain-containing protein [Duganella sp. CF517]|uniref:PEP-CTERM sorting domain-containing protein n=1 Tax=Duganella sp. CF517 TaxID=1881038 RepID=UPI0008C61B16|nr:PEP-CTERM sorting domain-containing protein [Duganella sp. CF517]SEN80283.1 PEP-CTERM protein-sorting domain-containing protein [Duganella sp. CF517]
MNLKHVVGMMALVGLSGLAQADTFANGGFESGSTSGWTTGGGYRGGSLNSAITPGDFLAGGALNSDNGGRGAVIDKNYVDPNVGALIGSTVLDGSYSYRAEDTTNGGFGTVISQQVKNYTDSDIYFGWKAVLENGGHSQDESAVMVLTLTDNTTGQLVLSRTYNAGNGGGGVDSRFQTYGDYFYTSAWQLERLSIDQSLSGHDFTLSLLAADCQPTGHTGYAYIDGFGAYVPPVPEPETYAMMLAGLGMMGWVARRKKSAKV